MRSRRRMGLFVAIAGLGSILGACASPCPPPRTIALALPPLPQSPTEGWVLKPTAYCRYHPDQEPCWAPAGDEIAYPYPPGLAAPDICQITPDAPQCQSHAAPSPRCRKDGPSCGPVYTSGGSDVPAIREPQSEQCLRWEGPRIPSPSGGAVMTDPCASDGECLVTRCGSCAGYQREYEICSVGGPAIGDFEDEPLDNRGAKVTGQPTPLTHQPLTWCGCVLGRCTLFTQ